MSQTEWDHPKKKKVKDTWKIVYLNSGAPSRRCVMHRKCRKMDAGISFFMVSSSDLKYKLMRHVTFNPLLFWIASGLISCIFIWRKKNSVWYNFYQGTSVFITFYIFEHYQLWMMDSKAQRVVFPKTPKLCVWHTEVRNCYHFKLVSHFQLWFPIWGALVNILLT